MMRARLSHGRLAALALVTVLAVPGGLVSAAVDTATHQACEREGHSCGTFKIAPCCCHAGPADQSAPATPASGRMTLTAPNLVPVALPAYLTSPPATESVSLAVLRLHSPPHPYYSGDLSIFFSTFLI